MHQQVNKLDDIYSKLYTHFSLRIHMSVYIIICVAILDGRKQSATESALFTGNSVTFTAKQFSSILTSSLNCIVFRQ